MGEGWALWWGVSGQWLREPDSAMMPRWALWVQGEAAPQGLLILWGCLSLCLSRSPLCAANFSGHLSEEDSKRPWGPFLPWEESGPERGLEAELLRSVSLALL